MKQQISVSISEKQIDELKKLSNETELSMSKIISLRMRGYEIIKRTISQDQQEPEKADDDLDEIRDKWYQKNQQRILEAWGKNEPNWHNILIKNPELGFKNAKELKSWILDRVSVKTTGQDSEQTAGQ